MNQENKQPGCPYSDQVGFCTTCYETHHGQPTPPPMGEWEEGLNTILWNNLDLPGINGVARPMKKELQDDLVAFFRKQLTSHQEAWKEQARKEIESKRAIWSKGDPNLAHFGMSVYNSAIDDVANLPFLSPKEKSNE